MFDSNGKLQWSAGTEGMGPGEYHRPMRAMLGPRIVKVLDLTQRRVTRLAPNGQFRSSALVTGFPAALGTQRHSATLVVLLDDFRRGLTLQRWAPDDSGVAIGNLPPALTPSPPGITFTSMAVAPDGSIAPVRGSNEWRDDARSRHPAIPFATGLRPYELRATSMRSASHQSATGSLGPRRLCDRLNAAWRMSSTLIARRAGCTGSSAAIEVGAAIRTSTSKGFALFVVFAALITFGCAALIIFGAAHLGAAEASTFGAGAFAAFLAFGAAALISTGGSGAGAASFFVVRFLGVMRAWSRD